jgi:hypothetical protein
MKKFVIGMACVLVGSFSFAQTGITSKMSRTTTTTTAQPVTSETTTTDTYTTGDVTTYEPGRTIVVKSDNDEGPVRFALGKTVRIVDRAGHIVHRALTPKDKVRVYYTGTGNSRVVERVEVED